MQRPTWGLLVLALSTCVFDLPSPQSSGGGSGGSGGHISCILGAGDSAKQHITALAAEGSGDIVVGGDFKGSMSFGGESVVETTGDNAGFVARIDGECRTQWARELVSTQSVTLGGVAIDATRVWVATAFDGTVDVGTPLQGTDRDSFLLELDAEGTTAASLQLGGMGAQEVHALVREKEGTLLVAGGFTSQLVAATTSLDSVGGWDAFLLRVTPKGSSFEVVGGWSFPATASADEADQKIKAVAVDDAGNIVIAGEYEGTPNFASSGTGGMGGMGGVGGMGGADVTGPCSLPTAQGVDDMFVAKLSSDGECLWARGAGDQWQDIAESVAVDRDGNVWFLGSFKGTIDLGTGPMTAPGFAADGEPHHNVVLAKLRGSDGETLWSEGFGDDDEQHGAEVVLSPDQGPIIAIQMGGIVDFDPQSDAGLVESPGETDVVVAKFNADGSLAAHLQYGDAAGQSATALALDALGLVIAGDFSGTLGEGEAIITGDSLDDVFVMRVPLP